MSYTNILYFFFFFKWGFFFFFPSPVIWQQKYIMHKSNLKAEAFRTKDLSVQ